jgi:catechol 2,3-dioxygenase-like lactoylglutathione lyase family enzyme
MQIHHAQLTLPPGAEGEARRFYTGLLGLPELPKPPELAGRGGVWFSLGEQQLHLGVEEPGPPSRRHIALRTGELAPVRRALEAAGVPVEEAIPLDGMERIYCRDPFGNKLELLSFGDG